MGKRKDIDMTSGTPSVAGQARWSMAPFEANFENGVLTLWLPKLEQDERLHIEVE
jgi:hypothetical protein